VIVGAPYIPAVTRFEAEDKPVLLIHSNAVKTIPVPSQPFQMVSRWSPQILKRYRGVHKVQLDLDSLP
jgi:hypothetical protein